MRRHDADAPPCYAHVSSAGSSVVIIGMPPGCDPKRLVLLEWVDRSGMGGWDYEVYPWGGYMCVTKYHRKAGRVAWTVSFRGDSPDWKPQNKGGYMANKYIRAATAAIAGELRLCEGDDPWLFGKRPALKEYMTSLEGPGGEVREPSAMMICVRQDGLAVGLKDEDMGGWLWRIGDTAAKCLDAIEKALADGSAKFAGPRQKKGGRAGGK